MIYCFEMFNGETTKLALLINPSFCDGIVRATMIAECAGYSDDGEYVFVKCQPAEFIAGGGPWTLHEYHGRIGIKVSDMTM